MNAINPRILFDELHPVMPLAVECLPLSKADFVHAVENLAGEASKPTLASGIDDMEAVYLVCPYGAWKQIFGEPRDIQEHHSVQAWEQPCSDGVIHCVGYFVDDPHDGKWVVLMRVCLF